MFVFRLCDHFKILNPQEVLALDADVLASWLAYFDIVGMCGVDRADYQQAATTAALYNVNSTGKKYSPIDCMVFRPTKPKPTVDELRQKILGGTK